MTREEAKDIVLNYALGQKINDGINTLDELINQIFDGHEAQLKAKENHIVELNKMVMEKNEIIDVLHISSSGFNDLYDDYRKLSRKICAMLFWEWKKAKIVVKKHEQKGEDVSYGKTVMYAREQMFKKAYAMLKDNA